MANNNTSITTLPLDLKLNMNKNKCLISTDSSMVNENNSPVYGSTISNLHTKSNGLGNAIYDKKGNKYYVESRVLKSTNSLFNDVDLSDKYYFEKKEFAISDINGIVWQDGRSIEKENGIYYAFKLNNGKLNMYKGEDVDDISYFTDINPWTNSYNIVSARLVPFNVDPSLESSEEGFYSPFIGILTIEQSVTLTNDDFSASSSTQNILVWRTIKLSDDSVQLGMVLPIVLGYYDNGNGEGGANATNKTIGKEYMSNKTGSFASSSQSTESSDWQIIVSTFNKLATNVSDIDTVRDDLYCDPRFNISPLASNKSRQTFGVSILNHKQRGENPYTSLRFDNFTIGYNGYNGDYIWTSWNFNINNVSKVGTRINNTYYGVIPLNAYDCSNVDSSTAYNEQVIRQISYTSDSMDTTTATYINGELPNYSAIFIDESPYVVATVTATNGTKVYMHRISRFSSSYTNNQDMLDILPVNKLCTVGTTYPSSLSSSDKRNAGPNVKVSAWEESSAYCTPYAIYGYCLTTNQRYARFIAYGNCFTSDQTGISNIGSVMVDSAMKGTVFGGVGLQSTQTIPTTMSAWGAWGNYIRSDPSYVCYNPQGSITTIGDTKWRILYNYRQGYISGLSFGENGKVGKLVTEWNTVDDSFFIFAKDNFILYKNDKNKKVYKIERLPFSSLDDNQCIDKFQIVDKRYFIGNIDIEYNCFDIIYNKYSCWASDWNNRVITGLPYSVSDRNSYLSGSTPSVYYSSLGCYCNDEWVTIAKSGKSKYINTGTVASGQNVSYTATKEFAPSQIGVYNTLNGFISGYETFLCASSDTGVDFYVNNTISSPVYKKTIKTSTKDDIYIFNDSAKEGLSYPIASGASTYMNVPIVGVEFIESYNGKFALKIDNSVYGIVYDGIRPIGLYNTGSLTDDVNEFFIVQGQYYAVVDNFISAVYYSSSGTLNSIEQIVDVNGMQFIGAFPSVAYFYAPFTQSIYAFTGDADLQLFVQSNKITEITNWLYDPATEWIMLNTNDGLYILTQINVFKNKSFTNVKNFYSTDKNYVVVLWGEDYKNTLLSLRKIDDDWETVPVKLETCYFGYGNFKEIIVDCWYIRVFKNDEKDNGKVKVYTTTLTDKVTKNKEEEFVIKHDMWDSNDCCFIRYQSNNQRGLGVSLNIESDYPISMISYSGKEDSTTLSKYNI